MYSQTNTIFSVFFTFFFRLIFITFFFCFFGLEGALIGPLYRNFGASKRIGSEFRDEEYEKKNEFFVTNEVDFIYLILLLLVCGITDR